MVRLTIWLCLITVMFGIGVFLFEYKNVKKAKQKRDMIVFSAALCFGVGFNMIKFIYPRIPTPMDAAVFMFHPIVKSIFHILS